MKGIFLLISLLVICLTPAMSQSDNVSAQSLSFKPKFGGAIELLGEDKVYRVIVPDEPPPAKGQTKKFAIFTSGLGLEAKRAKGEEPYYKAFRVISSGMKGVLREEDESLTTLAGSGFVKKVYFNFPLTIEVLNSTGEVEKTFQVISDVQDIYEYYHANSMMEGMFVEKLPFASAEQMNKKFAEDKDAILAKMERDAIQRTLYTKAKSVINAAYGSNKYPGGFLYTYAPSKSATGAAPDLAARCSELKNALGELNDKTKESGALAKLETSYTYFSNVIETGTIPSGLEQLYLGNAALAALVTGHLPQADDYFSRFYIQFTDNNKAKGTDFSGYYEMMYDVFGYYYVIKQSGSSVVSPPFRPRGFDDKAKLQAEAARQKREQADAEARAAMLPVFNGERGTAVLLVNKGKQEERVEGQIFYNFNKTTVESKGVIMSVPFKIAMSNGSVAEVDPVNVLYFIVGDKKYQRTVIKGGDFFKAAATAAGNLTFAEFWQVVQEDPDRAIYLQRVDKPQFAITKSAYLEAYDVADILKKRKPAKEFLDMCPQLVQAIDNKQIGEVNSLEDFKKFYQWMQNNCK